MYLLPYLLLELLLTWNTRALLEAYPSIGWPLRRKNF